MTNNILGIIGYPLGHSFSKTYFTKRFVEEGIDNFSYLNFPIENIEQLPHLISSTPNLKGFNVTFPYKKQIIPYLDSIDEGAEAIGAVNCVKITDGKLIGYNTDAAGFEKSLLEFLNGFIPNHTLVLGSGGASMAVQYVLRRNNLEYTVVSRTKQAESLTYQELTEQLISQTHLIINTTPLGMAPNVDSAPLLPYQALSNGHYLFDLVYNPTTTLFLKKGLSQGSHTINGYDMLIYQAEQNWKIFEIL